MCVGESRGEEDILKEGKAMEEEKLDPAFLHKRYLFRRKVFTLLGRAFQVYDEGKNLVLYSRQKPFKLREDFRVYSDQTQSRELFRYPLDQGEHMKENI